MYVPLNLAFFVLDILIKSLICCLVYSKSSLKDKEMIAETLLRYKEALIRSKEGKNTMKLVELESYERNPEDWKKGILRKEKASAMLSELTDIKNDPPAQIGDSENAGEDQADIHQLNKKRRRKRSAKVEQVYMGDNGEVLRVVSKKKRPIKITF